MKAVVDDQVSFDRVRPPLPVHPQAVTAAALLDRRHLGVEPYFNAETPRVVHEPRDEILLEMP